MTKNSLIPFFSARVGTARGIYFLAVNNVDYSKLNRDTSRLFCSIYWPPGVCLLSLTMATLFIIIISHPCNTHCFDNNILYHILLQIGAQKWRTMAWFWVQRNNNHIIVLPCFLFIFFFTGVLGSLFCCVFSSLMPAEQGQGMTIEWYFTEDWGRASRIREGKKGGGGGFISITSRMPRSFLEWHVYGTELGKNTLIL